MPALPSRKEKNLCRRDLLFAKFFRENLFESLAHFGDRNLFENFGGKSVHEHRLGLSSRNPSSPKVEQCILAKLAYSCSVSALDVVGKDLKLGLCVERRGRREQNSLIGLLRIGLLSILVDENLPVENPMRMVPEDRLVDLERIAIRLHMVDTRMIVDHLLVRSHVHPV